MFEHRSFDVYDFADITLNTDIYLMDDKWMAEWEAAMVNMLNGGKGEPSTVGYISRAAAISVGDSSIELSWYPNISTRFHELRIVLPRDQFIACVGCSEYDYKPRIFVKERWHTHLHLRSHSLFALVDAIGVTKALEEARLTKKLLLRLRRRIDTIAKHYPDVSFVSFADSLLLKSGWHVGQYNSRIKYSYEPEKIFRVLRVVRKAYAEVLNMRIYAVIAQGLNEYYDESGIHIAGNHISLNSLGLPFAQLLSIEKAARLAIREDRHMPADVYMDEDFYHSLHFVRDFAITKNEQPRQPYRLPMGTGESSYFYASFETIEKSLETQPRSRKSPRK